MNKPQLSKIFFLADVIADFNRIINVKNYFKNVGGKIVPVSRSQRKLSRIKDALVDLQRRGGVAHEGGYIVGSSGKISRYIPGESSSVDITLSRRSKGVDVLHNHPNSDSLSLGDLLGASELGNRIHAVSSTGSWYRATVIPNLETYLRNPAKFAQRQRQLTDTFLDSVENRVGLTLSPKQWDNASSAAQHAIMLDLNQMGLIQYRAKLTRKDKRVMEFFNPEIEAYLARDKKQDYHLSRIKKLNEYKLD